MNIKDMLPNMNLDTGIHYGCISQHSVDMSAMDDWYDNDAAYNEIKQEITDGLKNLLSDYIDPIDLWDITDEVIDRFNENYQNDEPAFYYESGEYSAEFSHRLVCWIIKKSPYYTYCKGCSPCVPNAGDLDCPVTLDEYNEYKNNVYMPLKRAYCLPDEFFVDDKAPYEYFEVKDHE